MKLSESLRISWRAITGHKLRSSLTTLGIVIGVGAVIVFMVLGGAFEQNILNDVDTDEENPNIQVTTQQSLNGGVQYVDAPIYTADDASRLEEIDGVRYVSPSAELPATQLRHDNNQLTGGFDARATNTDFFTDREFESGEVFDGDDEIVMTDALTELIDGEIAVGDEVTFSYRSGSTETFTVSGILGSDEESSPLALVSLENSQATVDTPDGDTKAAYSAMTISTEGTDVVDDVKDDAKSYLKDDSDAADLKQEEYDIKVQTPSDVVDQVSSIINQITLLIGGIAGISLVVGSIGIANIMIVSVTERTREIGIMKAIGASKRDVIQLFIVEAIILGVIGAVLGVMAGLGFGYLGVSIADWPMVYPLQWVGIAVAIGVSVGVLSGLYPAWSAARIDPIEALRHE
jgi:putative ABC transport system permease protein